MGYRIYIPLRPKIPVTIVVPPTAKKKRKQ
jgi:hypothetical protein